jgi:hypothetical protein
MQQKAFFVDKGWFTTQLETLHQVLLQNLYIYHIIVWLHSIFHLQDGFSDGYFLEFTN